MRRRRTKLTDILRGDSRDELAQAWSSTNSASERVVIPGGKYVAEITEGELIESRQETPGYRLLFRLIEGEHKGAVVAHTLWLTRDAMPYTKRDLSKLPIERFPEDLDDPLPEGIRCRVHVVRRADDDGNEINRVRSFEVLEITPPKPDPFAPSDEREATTENESENDEVPS